MKDRCVECDAQLTGEVPVEICQKCFCDFHELQNKLTTLRRLWHTAPAGIQDGLRLYHPLEYAKWVAAMELEQ